MTDDDVPEDADELYAEAGRGAEDEVLDAGKKIDEGVERDDGLPAVDLGAGDIRKKAQESKNLRDIEKHKYIIVQMGEIG